MVLRDRHMYVVFSDNISLSNRLTFAVIYLGQARVVPL